MRLCSLWPILAASSGLCRSRGFSTLSTKSAMPVKVSEVNSYGLEMRIFDTSYVNLCDEGFTLGIENCDGDPRSIGLAVKDWHQ